MLNYIRKKIGSLFSKKRVSKKDVFSNPIKEKRRKGCFKIYKSKINGEHRFKLISKNGKTVLSGEGYTTLQNCKKGIESIKINSKDINMYKLRKSKNNKYYCVLVSGNNKVIAVSQLYKFRISKKVFKNMIISVIESI